MSKQPHSASGPSTKAHKVNSSEPPHAVGHDEWLLDEALIETFPASDAIAISRYSGSPPLRTSPAGGPGKVEQTAIECEHCHTRIPATVALSFEGADYVYHFCGPQCLETWSKAAIRRDD